MATSSADGQRGMSNAEVRFNPPPPESPHRSSQRSRPNHSGPGFGWRYRGLIAFLAILGAAFGLRLVGLTSAFELWVDEMLYADLGRSVGMGQLPNLPDGPFFLHPPGFFIVEAGVMRLLGISGTAFEVVMQLRWLNALIGALSVSVAFLLVSRISNPTVAWGAAIALTFDPFVLRNNSRLFLETLGMAMVLCGLLVLVLHMQGRGRKHRYLLLILAGLLMGYGVLTKDIFAIGTLVPIALAAVWRRTLPVRDCLAVIGAVILPYATYLIILSANGLLGDWIWAKSNGLRRLAGVEKTTGFTADGSPDLASRLVDQLGQFGTSYIFLALGPVAAVIVCFSRRPERRMIGLVGFAFGLFGLYSAAFGTFEEQYGYGVIVAAVLTISALAAEIGDRRPSALRAAWPVAGVVLGFSVILGIRMETTTDNGYARAIEWSRNNLPADARISVTNGTAEAAFADDPRFGVWPSAPLMEANGARYILTQSLPTSQGYGYAKPELLAWLSDHATPRMRVVGPTNGETTLWEVDPDKLRQAAAEGIGSPPREDGL